MGRVRKPEGSLPWHNESNAEAAHKDLLRRLVRDWSDHECRVAITSLLEVLGRRRRAAERDARRGEAV